MTATVGAAAAVAVVAGVREVSWLVAPAFLAAVIVITVLPVQRWLRARGVPSWLATTLLAGVVYGALIALTAVLVVSLAQLAAVLPRYRDEATALADSVTRAVADLGVDAHQLGGLAAGADYGGLVSWTGDLVRGVSGALSSLALLLTLLFFLSMEAAGARLRLALLAEDRPRLADALRGFARSTRRCVAVSTAFGLLTGLVDAVALALLGVPLAPLWGLLVFITNYVPYVGFWIGIVPPTLLALLEGGWHLALAVAAVYTLVNFVLTLLIEPKYIGDVVDLSVTVTLVSLVFWAWVLGSVGAILAVPLTLLVKALLEDANPRARWADALLRSDREIRARSARSRREPTAPGLPAAEEPPG
ncbi:AI-2E family transporter [Modestobacter caceresii]|uniref:AI-2E family transporter n=1 Tax=Modestobacter caceresii TaxID=1522368 RepID=UPI0007EC6EC2|nr:AI-2E family transporter [Modestobacter caceresii]